MRTLVCFFFCYWLAYTTAQNAQIRIINASPDSPTLDVMFNGTTKFSKVDYQDKTDYIPVPAGSYNVQFSPSSDHKDVIFNAKFTFLAGKIYTGLGYGLVLPENYTSTPFEAIFQEDQNTAPQSIKKARLRFVHASPGSSAVVVKGDNGVWFSNIRYTQFSDYMEIDAKKNYRIDFFLANDTTTPICSVPSLSVVGGRVSTLMLQGIIGAHGTQELTAEHYTDAAFTYFYVRAANAAPQTHLVYEIDGDTIFPEVAYQTLTDYVSKPAGTYNITIRSTLTGTTVSKRSSFKTDELFTLLAVGFDKSDSKNRLDLAPIQDSHATPSGQATTRVRFVHASPDAPTFSVKADDTMWFKNLAYKGPSEYKEIGTGEYKIEIFAKGDDKTPLLTLPRQKFEGGHVYTVLIEGTVEDKTLKGIISSDVSFQYFSLSLAHASPDAPNLDLYAEIHGVNQKAFNNVAYSQITDYKSFILRETIVRVTQAGNASNVLFTIHQSEMKPNTVHTLAAIGLVNTEHTQYKLKFKLLDDDNGAPSSLGKARLRFVHSSPELSNVDVRANGMPLFTNVAYGEVADYQEIGSKNYRLSIFPAGNLTDPVLVVDSFKVEGGAVHTVFAIGMVGSDKKPLRAQKKTHATFKYFTMSVTHTSPNTGDVSVLVDGEEKFSSIKYTAETKTLAFVAKPRWIDVVAVGSSTPLISKKIKFAADKQNTLSIVGLSQSNQHPLDLLLIENNWSLPSSQTKARVRFVHLAPNMPPVDVKANRTTLYSNVSYLSVTAYKELPADCYDLAAFTTGTNESRPILAQLMDLEGGNVYTIFAEGIHPDKLKLRLRIDYTPPPTFRMRVIHASPGMGHVDVLINDQSHFLNLPYSRVTKYESFPIGTYTFKVVPAGKLSPVYAVADNVIFNEDEFHSLLIWGLVQANTAAVANLLDNNSLPHEDNVKIRFVHASPDAPPISVKLNGVETFRNVAFKQITEYKIADTNKYKLEVYPSGGDPNDPVFSDSFDFTKGSGVFTAIAEGLLHGEPGFRVMTLQDAGEKPTPPHPDDDGKNKGLTKAGLAAIITVSVVCGVALLGGILYVVSRNRRRGYSRLD